MSNGTQLVSEMTEEEQLESVRAYLKVEEGLEDAIALLIARKVNFATKETELKLIRIELADFKAELAKVRARLIAFEKGRLSMKPPSPQVVKDITKHAAKLDKLVAKAQKGDTIVAAGKLLVQAWEKTQSPPSA